MLHKSPNPEVREAHNKMRQEQKSYLDKRVIEAEGRHPFIAAYREAYEDGDYDKILTEAEKLRMFYLILDFVKLKEVPIFLEQVKEHYPSCNDDESLLYFLKKAGCLEELSPLWSKAKAVRALKEGRTDTMSSDLLDSSRKITSVFVNTKKVAEMYG